MAYLAVAGEALNPGRDDLLRVAEVCDVERKEALEVLDQVREAVAGWRTFAEEAGVPGPVAREIERELRGSP